MSGETQKAAIGLSYSWNERESRRVYRSLVKRLFGNGHLEER